MEEEKTMAMATVSKYKVSFMNYLPFIYNVEFYINGCKV